MPRAHAERPATPRAARLPRGTAANAPPGLDDVMPAPEAWVAALDEALTMQLAAAARGPRREGLFALWIVVRAAADAAVQFAVEPALWPLRHEALVQRLSSLALSAPLRRALSAAVGMLATPSAANGALVLAHLAAPVRDVLGAAAAEAVDAAAHAARAPARHG